ncbi:MAG: hypothetical protein ABUK01_18275, partial [Leptospirales bacterium]
SSDIEKRLRDLEKTLVPCNILEFAKVHVFSSEQYSYALDDALDIDSNLDLDYQRVKDKTRNFGRQVAKHEEVLDELLPELLIHVGEQIYYFSQGLAEGCSDSLAMWLKFRNQFRQIPKEKRCYALFGGFLNALSQTDPVLTDRILDESVSDELLTEVFPLLQFSVEIDIKGVSRIKEALRKENAPIWRFQGIAYGRNHESICDTDLVGLLHIIALKTDGLFVAIEILKMRIHGLEEKVPDSICTAGQELLLKIDFINLPEKVVNLGHTLSSIIEACFKNGSAEKNAENILSKITLSAIERTMFFYHISSIIRAFAKVQPVAWLDGVINTIIKNRDKVEDFYIARSIQMENPLSEIEDDLILSWCAKNPTERYSGIATQLAPFQISSQDDIYEWRPIAKAILEKAPDSIAILNRFYDKYSPNYWSTVMSINMERSLPLLDSLISKEKVIISEWAKNKKIEFLKAIESWRKMEEHENRNQNESFE